MFMYLRYNCTIHSTGVYKYIRPYMYRTLGLRLSMRLSAVGTTGHVRRRPVRPAPARPVGRIFSPHDSAWLDDNVALGAAVGAAVAACAIAAALQFGTASWKQRIARCRAEQRAGKRAGRGTPSSSLITQRSQLSSPWVVRTVQR